MIKMAKFYTLDPDTLKYVKPWENFLLSIAEIQNLRVNDIVQQPGLWNEIYTTCLLEWSILSEERYTRLPFVAFANEESLMNFLLVWS